MVTRRPDRARLAFLSLGILGLLGCGQRSGAGREPLRRIEERLAALEERVETRSSGRPGSGSSETARLQALEKSLAELQEMIEDSDARWSREIASLRDDVQRLLSDIETKRAIEDVEKRASADLDALKAELLQGRVTLFENEGRIETTGVICQNEVLLEWLLVCKGGKTHESVVLLDCRPSLLNAALLALGYRPGLGARVLPAAKENPPGGVAVEGDLVYYPPQGERVHVYLEWTEDGKSVRRRVEECIRNVETGKTMEPAGWVYLGSRFARLEPGGREVFVADVTRDVAAIWHSFEGNAVLDYAGIAGKDDHTHYAIREKLPPKGAPVKIVLSREAL
jgi:hypothetical protein